MTPLLPPPLELAKRLKLYFKEQGIQKPTVEIKFHSRAEALTALHLLWVEVYGKLGIEPDEHDIPTISHIVGVEFKFTWEA